ncbi:GNAT family N-acetyltransferase [Dactylosporangium sp. AC04546]|uniref:GNAT family N-acetyltransferase n=1 Tax=Dactylosporangium sp. AC04546 TaxID=2862460 RepID=UPI001EDEA591|nr:GNAT family N-acetyltransferase [Dactylosporangium sp. AC04546]WVK88865.1 GNAT family N-acetyltransferase [Dactylosporangium sp. AC04546]
MISRVAAADVRLLERAMDTFGAMPGGGRAFLESPSALAFVASQAGEIFGWSWGYHLIRPDTSSMLYLHQLEVAQEHRRRGIGRALLQAFMSAGAQAGAARMFLTTGEANAPARALYESLGGGLAAQGPTVSYWFRLYPDATASVRPGSGPEAGQPSACQALLLTGAAGVGKSTVADAVGRQLAGAGHVTAVVDTDMLAQFGPPPNVGPAGGRLYDELKCVNLASVWTNFRAAGARFLVAAAVIDSVAQRERYVRSLSGCDVRVVRLIADVDTVRIRLRQRDTGPKLEQHLRTLDEHSPTASSVEDFTVTNDRTPAEVAAGILVRAGWTGQVDRPTADRTPP